MNAADERKPKDTEEQFIYKSRKKAIGPFKRDFWNLPAEIREVIGADLETRFAFLFQQLNIGDTKPIVDQFIHAPEIHKPLPTEALKKVVQESVEGLAD